MTVINFLFFVAIAAYGVKQYMTLLRWKKQLQEREKQFLSERNYAQHKAEENRRFWDEHYERTLRDLEHREKVFATLKAQLDNRVPWLKGQIRND